MRDMTVAPSPESPAYASYKELEGHVLELIARGEDVAGVLAELDDRGDALMAGDDLDGLLRFGADVDRLFRNLESDTNPELQPFRFAGGLCGRGDRGADGAESQARAGGVDWQWSDWQRGR